MIYKSYTVCEECGAKRPGLFDADDANASRDVCRNCGARGKFVDVVKAWVSTASLLRPWTWGSGYFVGRDGERI